MFIQWLLLKRPGLQILLHSSPIALIERVQAVEAPDMMHVQNEMTDIWFPRLKSSISFRSAMKWASTMAYTKGSPAITHLFGNCSSAASHIVKFNTNGSYKKGR